MSFPLMPRSEAISCMNDYAHHNVPFVFWVDFDAANGVVQQMKTEPPGELLFDFNGLSNDREHAVPPARIEFSKRPVSLHQYRRAFENVQRHLHEGNTYLVNLTFPTAIETNLNLRQIFAWSRAKYKLFVDDRFVVFSPETFVQIRRGSISAFPRKGTIDAALPGAERRILEDEKEMAEHATIVDLLRNDLNLVSHDVRVKRYRYVECLRTHGKKLLQVSSEITGTLAAGYGDRIGEIIFTLLPAGSVSGAPKRRTLEIIKESEGRDRGFYTGVCGYYADGSVDCGVMIRFIEKQDRGLFYYSGGGITAYSDVRAEYHELIDKVYLAISGHE